VGVDSLEAMVEEIQSLLAAPARIDELSRRARGWARGHLSWPDYVERVDAALANDRRVEPSPEAQAWMRGLVGGALVPPSGGVD
jgi:hypothetical protein